MRRYGWSLALSWALAGSALAQQPDDGLPAPRLERARVQQASDAAHDRAAPAGTAELLAKLSTWARGLELEPQATTSLPFTAGDLAHAAAPGESILGPSDDPRPIGRSYKVECATASIVITHFDDRSSALIYADALLTGRYAAWEELDPDSTREFTAPEVVAQRGTEVLQAWGPALESLALQGQIVDTGLTAGPLLNVGRFHRDYSLAKVQLGSGVAKQVEAALAAARDRDAESLARVGVRWVQQPSHLAFAFSSGVQGEALREPARASYWMARTTDGATQAEAAFRAVDADAVVGTDPQPAPGERAGLEDVLRGDGR